MNVGVEEVASVQDALAVGQRLDGRSLLELPPVQVMVGHLQQAIGSSIVRMGDMEVIVGVKVRQAGWPLLTHNSKQAGRCKIQSGLLCVSCSNSTTWEQMNTS